ncbi:MAG: phosphoserine phosphatase SerB [Pseudomonadota bacterium]
MSLVLTLISHPDDPKLTDTVIGAIADHLGRAIDVTWLNPGIACDIALIQGETANTIAPLAPMLTDTQIDYAVLHADGRRKALLLADMDSTMIEQECIDELAASLGLKDQVAAITEKAMRGDIAFELALRERVFLLAGLPVSAIDIVFNTRISLRSGGRTLVRTMKAHGAYTALVSGGFTHFTNKIADLLDFDEHRANRLMVSGSTLSGQVAEPILGASAKLEALEDLTKRLDLRQSETMAIGDGANDLAMIEKAGMGVAVRAKPKVAERADHAIQFGDLTALLYLQGYRKSAFSD